LTVAACSHQAIRPNRPILKNLFCRPGLELLFDRPRPNLSAESDPTTVLDGAILTLNCQENP